MLVIAMPLLRAFVGAMPTTGTTKVVEQLGQLTCWPTVAGSTTKGCPQCGQAMFVFMGNEWWLAVFYAVVGLSSSTFARSRLAGN
jgi:hypothetical protein